MNEIYKKFSEYLEAEEKENSVMYILDKLQNNEIDVIDLYCNILTPVLNQMECKLDETHLCIWKEHVRTAIVRTIVECCYPYVIKKKRELDYLEKGIAVILCPPEEYHDLGARMVADFFTICGFQSIFVGSNTPYQDFYNAISIIHPKLVAISVSNYYNLVATKKIIKEIKAAKDYPLSVVVGGNAFNKEKDKYKLVGADYYASSFEDIKRITESEVDL